MKALVHFARQAAGRDEATGAATGCRASRWNRRVAGPAWSVAAGALLLVAGPSRGAAQPIDDERPPERPAVRVDARFSLRAPGTELEAAPATRGTRAPYDPGVRTRSRPAHVAGLVLGVLGIAGGSVLILGGTVRLVSPHGGGGIEFITGAVIAPVGALALIASTIALCLDREPVRRRIDLRASPDGVAVTFTMAF
jgi:hypothetical protein